MADILFHVDEPLRWDNPVPLLFVRGWCFSASGPAVMAVVARTPEGEWRGVHGLPRPDVARAFVGGPETAESGFALRFPRPANLPAWLQIEAILDDDSVHVAGRHLIN